MIVELFLVTVVRGDLIYAWTILVHGEDDLLRNLNLLRGLCRNGSRFPIFMPLWYVYNYHTGLKRVTPYIIVSAMHSLNRYMLRRE